MAKKNISVLLFINDRLGELPQAFRAQFCQICSYSLPTFYRRCKEKPKDFNKTKKFIKDIETVKAGEAVISVMDNLYKDLYQYYPNELREWIRQLNSPNVGRYTQKSM